eukprot:CAMPEP_0113704460 /NCGR_PEP_ID=MMETSP0038_2-20120614/26534_1 /TAXON_ID=2898 /ORGANISM="Cryptomonas paramecium" /LENGTH=276 /DNA_ID=CAMNT_0000629249 /DNA_START=65 /DNA_END=892 /DNA_ORIENTATION=- /assembly_acc=CAM_ASM_000170
MAGARSLLMATFVVINVHQLVTNVYLSSSMDGASEGAEPWSEAKHSSSAPRHDVVRIRKQLRHLQDLSSPGEAERGRTSPFSTPWKVETELLRFNFPGLKTIDLRTLSTASAVRVGEEYIPWDRNRYHMNSEPLTVRTQRLGAGSVRTIWVWGERNSCTTSITEALAKNFQVDVSGGEPWKHSFMRRADMTLEKEAGPVLHLLVTRHPYEWMVSMQRGGFGAPLHRTLNMSTFLRTEWMSLLDDEPVLEQYARHHPPQVLPHGDAFLPPSAPAPPP